MFYDVDTKNIDKLAHLSIKRGVALQKGQNLLITAPLESLPLVRKIAKYAYKEGAGLVTPLFNDSDITLSRFKYGNDESFNIAANWLYNGMGEAFDNNTARMAIAGDDPMLLSEIDPDKVSRANKANAVAYKPARERITEFKINWNIISWPGKAWAKRVFPDLDDSEAIKKLGDAIFHASRVSNDDPVSEWDQHNKNLRDKTDWLNAKNFHSLKYSGPGTSLTVGLADDHEWMGGASEAQNGIICNPNIPSEEVFTTPHASRVSGEVCSTKPLSYQGTLIEDINVRFEDGKIVDAKSSKGQDVLLKVLDSDEGSRRLGEVALVPNSSPISQLGITFYNTLFDENAASHIALGQCYSKCFKSKKDLSKEEITERGGNLFKVNVKNGLMSKISNLPEVFNVRQGGLLDVLIDKESVSERKVYICYSSKVSGGSSTTLMAGTLKEDKLISKKILFKSNNVSESGVHFGCRLAILNDEIFMSIGDRGNRYEAQDANSHAGSVIRVNKYDGSTREQKAYNSWPAEVYTKGHRNPQGMAINSKTNEIWVNEHGPKGGDEINVLKPGKNYGWPIVTYGEEYWGGKIGQGITSLDGFEIQYGIGCLQLHHQA